MNDIPDKIMNCNSDEQCEVVSHSPDCSITQKMVFGKTEVERLNVQAVLAVLVFVLVGFISIMFVFKNNNAVPADIYAETNIVYEVTSGEEMIELLKENNLWEIDPEEAITPLLFSSYPGNIDTFPILDKKRVFFHGLLPVALTVLDEVGEERKLLMNILAKFSGGYRQVAFLDDYSVWGKFLTADEIEFIMTLVGKYRTASANEMVKRVGLVPLSMILAQGAIESSWATSRFAREGNNLFGIWTWSEKGMIPEERDENKNHRVAMYGSILDSVRAYVLNLNRLPAYKKFREIRKGSMNSLKLADGLINYSERRDVYVWEVKDFIRYNNLRQYDKCFLVDKPRSFKEVKVIKLTQREMVDAG